MTTTDPPPWSPDTAQTRAAAIIGTDGHLVEITASISNGLSALHVLGLPGAATAETRDRVRAAIINSGQCWPGRAVTVTLRPASLPKYGSGFDLAIAVAVLAASGAVPAAAAGGCVFVAELGLDGSLRPVRGVLPALLAAASAGYTRAVVAAGNTAEAAMVPDMTVVPCHDLPAVVAWLRREPSAPQPGIQAVAAAPADVVPAGGLAGLAVAPHVRRALEVCAAGGHHLCLTGQRGAAIPALAAGLAGVLPELTSDEAMEVTSIHSVAGLLASGGAVVTRPPYRSPHHTATRAAILGGGSGIIRPGEAALAHRGVLFLDDAPEFAVDVLAALREPMASGEVVVARHGRTVRFPARFILVAGMRPCPCGGQPGCACTPFQVRRYRARLASQLGSCISLWLRVTRPIPADPGGLDNTAEPDSISSIRVAQARDRARRRLRNTPWRVNADIPGAELRRSYQPPAESLAALRRAVDLGEISTRAADQVVRVAWTLADLAGNARPGAEECGQALAFHLGTAR